VNLIFDLGQTHTLHPGRRGSGQIQSQELTHMNWAAHLRCEVLRSLWNRKLTLRVVALIFAGVASIGIAYGALQAQDRAGLDSILDEIAAGRKVSPRKRTSSWTCSRFRMVTSSMRSRTIRLRSRSAVPGSFHSCGKFVARATTCFCCTLLTLS
jgi:hypothetical protein